MEQPSPSLLKRIKNAIKSVVNGGQDKTKGSHEGKDLRDDGRSCTCVPPLRSPACKALLQAVYCTPRSALLSGVSEQPGGDLFDTQVLMRGQWTLLWRWPQHHQAPVRP